MSRKCHRHANCCPPPVTRTPFKATPYLRPPRKPGPIPRPPNNSWNWSVDSVAGLGTPLGECTPASPISSHYTSTGSVYSGRSNEFANPTGESTPCRPRPAFTSRRVINRRRSLGFCSPTKRMADRSIHVWPPIADRAGLGTRLGQCTPTSPIPCHYGSSDSVYSERSNEFAAPTDESTPRRPRPAFTSRLVDRRRSLGFFSPRKGMTDRSIHDWPPSVCARQLQSPEDSPEDCSYEEFQPPWASTAFHSTGSFLSNTTMNRSFIDPRSMPLLDPQAAWSADAYSFHRNPFNRIPEATAEECLEAKVAQCFRGLFKRWR